MKSYDPKQESKCIIYLDANNIYGYAMSKFLPRSGFKWIDPTEFDLNKYTSNSSKACVPKVDLIYQPSTHTTEESFTDLLTTKVEHVTVLIKQTALYKKNA